MRIEVKNIIEKVFLIKPFLLCILSMMLMHCDTTNQKNTFRNQGISIHKDKKTVIEELKHSIINGGNGVRNNAFYSIVPSSWQNEFSQDFLTNHREKIDNYVIFYPSTTDTSSTDSISGDGNDEIFTDNFHEYFFVNHEKVIIFLNKVTEDGVIQENYFIEILSSSFFAKFEREWQQIKKGTFGKDKKISSSPFMKQIGSLQVEIYFTPTEFQFSTSSLSSYRYKMKQINTVTKPRPDLWRLLSASQSAAYFNSYIQDPQLITDFIEQSFTKKRWIYANSTSFLNENLQIHDPLELAVETIYYPFSFMWGKNLEMHEDLIDGVSFLSSEKEKEITSDFLFIFNLNPGNPKEEDLIHLNQRDGIVILIRGEIDKLLQDIYESIGLDESNHYVEAHAFDAIHTEVLENAPHSYCTGEIIIAGVGDKINNVTVNDYILLYNKDNTCAHFYDLYIARDSNCSIEQGWTEYRSLPSFVQLPPHSYYLISREGNEINGDFTWSGALSNRYCVALVRSKIAPTSLADQNILSYIDFTDTNEELLQESDLFTRFKSNTSFMRKGRCHEQVVNNNINDFIIIEHSEIFLPNRLSSQTCVPGGE